MYTAYRHRSRNWNNSKFTLSYKVVSFGTTLPTVYTASVDPWFEKFEYIVDTTRLIGNWTNPVYHVKIESSLKGDLFHPSDNFGSGYASTFYPFLPYGIHTWLLSQILQKPPNQWLSDFGANATQHFTSAVEDGTTILNFIFEAIELLAGNVKKAKQIVEKSSTALKIFWKAYEKLGSFWLAWNFAIKPTISDIKNLIFSIQTSNKRIAWLIRRNHKDTLVKYRQSPYVFSGTTPVYNIPGVPSRTINGEVVETPRYRVVYTGKFQYNAMGLVRFSIPDQFLEGFEGKAIGWLDLSGLYNPLKVIWEAIPFSWLVDWFVNKKTQLQLEAANLSPLTNGELKQSIHSCKCSVEGRLEIFDFRTSKWANRGPIRISIYQRLPGLPDPAVSPFRIPIEWYNLSILAALLKNFRR